MGHLFILLGFGAGFGTMIWLGVRQALGEASRQFCKEAPLPDSMTTRYLFPLFNALVGAIFGALIGYYVFQPLAGFFIGGLGGLAPALALEFGLRRLGPNHWLYRRRVLLLVLAEIPLVIFVIGPYAVAVVETRPYPQPVCCETPLDYGAPAYETLEIQVADDIALAGWFVPPAQSPGPAVLLLHGAGSDRRGAAWHAEQLIHAGYGVLLYDQRATGESGGEQTSFGWLDPPDLLAAADYLAARPDVDPRRVGVVGLSAGAHIALNAATAEPERFGGLWLDGVGAQRLEDFPAPENLGERFALLINGQVLTMLEIRLDRPAPPPFQEILAGLERPAAILVAGGLDGFEARVNRQYAQAAHGQVAFWMIDEAWHLGGPQVAPEAYRQRMLSFFDEAIGEPR